MSNASKPGARGKARQNATGKRSLKKGVSEKTRAAQWDPYMLMDNIESDEKLLRLEASVVAKTKATEGLQDDDEQRVRSAQGQMPAKKGRSNNRRAAVAVSASTPTENPEMPAVNSVQTKHQVQTKRKAPGVAARGGDTPVTQERLVQVKEPELPLDEPAPQEALHVAGNLSPN